jgi:DNA-binding beta-propeller fold protein YncE
MSPVRTIIASILLTATAGTAAATNGVTLTPLGSFASGFYENGGAEIPVFDALTRRAFVVNAGAGTVDVLDLRNPASPTRVRSLDLNAACNLPAGGKPNSVDAKLGIVAVALEAPVKTDPGRVVFFSAFGDNRCIGDVVVGALPDMLTFSPDGRYVLTANEGEPSTDYTIDPAGSVSVIDLWQIGRPGFVRTADFTRFDSPAERQKLLDAGVRLFGKRPGGAPSSVSEDLEPEYIAIDGRKAYVTLQEANALAVVDIASARVDAVVALGLKDHSLAGNGLDASDRDGPANGPLSNIALWPVSGLYQPDAIRAFSSGGRSYLITANEGDARDYAALAEESRVGAAGYVLDPVRFPNAAALKANAALGRLTVSRATGDTDGDGDFDRIDVFGARSISIWDTSGRLVWDSGDELEREVARLYPSNFNTGHTTSAPDDRSDNKGPEPEGLAVGEVRGRTYAFVGLERQSAIAVYDIENPRAPRLISLVDNRDYTQPTSRPCTPPATGNCPNPAAGDLGPEGLDFVPAWLSPTRKALLLVGNEVSGTTTIWQVD